MCQTWLECFFFCRQKKIGPRSIGKGPLTERCVLFPLLPCLHSYYWLNLDLTIFDASELLPPALPVCRRVSPRVRLPPHDQGRDPSCRQPGETGSCTSSSNCRPSLLQSLPQLVTSLPASILAPTGNRCNCCRFSRL